MPTIRANDVELFYDLSGPEDAPVVVFSTSVGATLEMWDPQLRALSNRFRLLRYDTRGAGMSQKVRGELHIDAMADDIAALLDTLGIAGRVALAGVAVGGATTTGTGEFWMSAKAKVPVTRMAEPRFAAVRGE